MYSYTANTRVHTMGMATDMSMNGMSDEPLLMKLPMQNAVAEYAKTPTTVSARDEDSRSAKMESYLLMAVAMAMPYANMNTARLMMNPARYFPR